ncbi:MAG: Spy/CpxP family protein refolding chaperone [Opitutales bacterium]
MMISTRLVRFFTVAALAIGMAAPASGQFPGTQEQPDQVDQLAQLLGLSEEQQTEIRTVIDEIGSKIEELQVKAQELQQELQEQVGPDFNEDEIRKTATKLGEATGEMTALSVILQSKVEAIFTEEQRETLKDLERQQQQAQQEQMQRQLQQQLQQQQLPPQQSQGSGGTDPYGRDAGDPHYGHDHP